MLAPFAKKNPLDYSALKQKALFFLARREYAYTELIRKLTPYADAGLAQKVVDELRDEGKQNDARFARAKIESLARKYGTQKMRQALHSAGINMDAEVVLPNREEELAKIADIVRKKGYPQTIEARAKLIRHLRTRGFTGELIQQGINAARLMAD